MTDEYPPGKASSIGSPTELRVMSVGMERRAELALLLGRFGLKPTQQVWERLNRAFVHRSYRTEANLDEDNERLEFLGDSVIALLTTEYLLMLYPALNEGWLSKLRASMVSRAVLGEIGRELRFGDLLVLGTGEERSGGRLRPSIIGSALEAFCGVLYLYYPYDLIREPIRTHVIIPALDLVQKQHLVDYKSQLQEWTQRQYQKVPDYTVVTEEGPDHSKVFEVEVRIGETVLGRGRGNRKKTAENDAARQALAASEGPVSPV